MKSQTRIKSEKVLEILFANQYKFRSPDVLRKTVELTQDLVEAGRAKDEKYYLVWYEHLKVAKTLHKAEVRRMLVKNRRMDPSMPFETWNVVASESLDLACSRALKPGDKAKVGEITIAIKLSRPRKEILSEVDARAKAPVALARNDRRIPGAHHASPEGRHAVNCTSYLSGSSR